MKRFQYDAASGRVKKIDKKITIKERIELGLGLLSPGLKDTTKRPVQYELTGIVLHHGISAEGGHYTAESKRNDKWYRIDDNKVSEVKLSEVIHTDNRRTPYLLTTDSNSKSIYVLKIAIIGSYDIIKHYDWSIQIV